MSSPGPALILGALAVLATVAPASPAAAVWPPITDAEEAIAADPGGSQPAVILFEEGGADDRAPGGRTQAFHRRLKILTPAGLGYAHVSIRLVAPEQTLEGLEGRGVDPSGREVELSPDSISRGEVSGGLTEVRFDLPAAAPGAILEYRYTLKGGGPPPMGGWVFQHEIPCLRSTFLWKPGLERTSHWTLIGAELFDPTVEPLASPTAAESLSAVRFEIMELPARVAEYSGPPVIETRPRLVTTYTDLPLTADEYWDAFAAAAEARQEEFSAGRSRLVEQLLAQVPPPRDFESRVRAAYRLAQTAVRNAAAGGETPPPLPATADSLLAMGVADPEGVDLLFIAALKALDVTATRAFVVDRDQAFFHRNVVSAAQFTRSLVAVAPDTGTVYFFSPGTPLAPPGVIPWFTQGVTALVPRGGRAAFVPTPVDRAPVNQTTRNLQAALDAGGRLEGRVSIAVTGQPELETRQQILAGSPDGFRSRLESEWRRGLPGLRIDSLRVVNLDSSDRNLALAVVFHADRSVAEADNRLLVNAALLARETRNPFEDGPRRDPVFLPYAGITADNVVLTPPPGWTPESIPDAVEFDNAAGSFRAIWSFDGEHLVYQRTFVVARPRIPPEEYSGLRQLHAAAVSADAILVPLVLAPRPPSRR